MDLEKVLVTLCLKNICSLLTNPSSLTCVRKERTPFIPLFSITTSCYQGKTFQLTTSKTAALYYVDLGHKTLKSSSIYFNLTLAKVASFRTMNLPPGIITVRVSVSTVFVQVITVDVKHILHCNENENIYVLISYV